VIRRLQACLNGSRTRTDHPAVPLTPAELAHAADRAVDAGAEAVHLHPRDPDGAESVAAGDVGAAAAAVRASCPGTPIGVSTGLWITGGDAGRRFDAVAGWAGLPAGQRPDFASVNVSEEGFAGLSRALTEIDVGVEAGVWSLDDVAPLTGVPVERVLIEVQDTGLADEIILRLDRLGLAAPRLLHGEDAACWPLLVHAGRLGLPTRIGLEDTLVTDDGRSAPDNAALVRRALRVWSDSRHARR
jgi:uncharacterized protein (DUF849 family)